MVSPNELSAVARDAFNFRGTWATPKDKKGDEQEYWVTQCPSLLLTTAVQVCCLSVQHGL